jgi:soluble lytic murein transglycosylase-like protein
MVLSTTIFVIEYGKVVHNNLLKEVEVKDQTIEEMGKEIEDLKEQIKTAHKVKSIMRKYAVKECVGETRQIIYEEIMASWNPVYVATVMAIESRFRVNAVSICGARGLMQIMPLHGDENSTFDIRKNIRFGAKYLKEQYDKFGSEALMIAGYNAGPGAVKKYKGVPPYQETLNYIILFNEIMNQANTAPMVA